MAMLVCKQIISKSSKVKLPTNILHIIYIYLNEFKQVIDVKLLLLHSNPGRTLLVV